jgi:signal transduction histidine kinase
MNNLLEDALANQTQLRNLARKLVEAQETERRHIARELHDEVGQELTALKLSLGLAARSETGHEKSRLDDAAELIDDLVAKVRNFSLRFRPAMLDDLGLVPTLLWYFKSFTAQTNIQVNFQHTLDRRFSTELETTAYRIVQESLTNAARHAKVSEISVRISANRQFFRIEIEDHGAGFDPTTTTQETAGLTGMRERAASMGGHLTVVSFPGAGTLVLAEFPLKEGRSDFTDSRSADG